MLRSRTLGGIGEGFRGGGLGFHVWEYERGKGLRSRGEVVASIDLEMDVLGQFIADKSSLKIKFSIQRLPHRP